MVLITGQCRQWKKASRKELAGPGSVYGGRWKQWRLSIDRRKSGAAERISGDAGIRNVEKTTG